MTIATLRKIFQKSNCINNLFTADPCQFFSEPMAEIIDGWKNSNLKYFLVCPQVFPTSFIAELRKVREDKNWH